MFLYISLFVTRWLTLQTLMEEVPASRLFPVDNGMVNEGLSNVTWRQSSSCTPGVASLWCLPCGKEGKGKEVLPVAWLTVTSSCLVYWWARQTNECVNDCYSDVYDSGNGYALDISESHFVVEKETNWLLKYLQHHWWQCNYPAVWHLFRWTVLEKPSS